MSRLPPLALAFHGVSDVSLRRDPLGLFVSPGELRRHLARVRSWGYELVGFAELARLAVQRRADGHAALTFDDGFVDNLETLVPLLRDEDAPATVFVVSGWLGEPHPDAPWTRIVTHDELRELGGSVEIGAHSTRHDDLSSLSYESARADLETCKRELEAVVGPVEHRRVPVRAGERRHDPGLPRRGFRGGLPYERRGLVGRSAQPAAPGHAQPLERPRPTAEARRPVRAADALRARPGGAESLAGAEGARVMSHQRPVVLVYHGVGFASEGDPHRLVTSPEHLIEHVRLLLGRGYRFLSAGELPQDGPAPGTVALTFDDGWRNWLTVALPVLRSLDVCATFFVCPGLFGQQHPDVPGEAGELIRAEEARALHDAGMELGSHTLTHPDLRTLDDAELVAGAGRLETGGRGADRRAVPHARLSVRPLRRAGRPGRRRGRL